MKEIKLLITILGMFFYTSCLKSKEVTPIFPCTSELKDPYGINSHFYSIYRDYPLMDKELKILSELGVNIVRVSYGVDYSNSDFASDPVYIRWDSIVSKMRDSQLKCLPVYFVGTENKHPWDYPENYVNNISYLQKIVGRDVGFYEIMNEVNLVPKSENLSLDTISKLYTSSLSLAYKNIKKANTHSKVLCSGLSGTADRFVEKLSEQRAYDYFDILNIHAYHKPEDLRPMYQYLSNIMKKYGWEKPVWLTECGMSTCIDKKDSSNVSRAKRAAEEEQARRLPRIFLISFAYGVDKVIWYEMRSRERDDYDKEENFGLLHSDLTPKPAFNSYKTLIEMCPSGSSRPKLRVEDDVYYCEWTTPDDQRVTAIWSPSQKRKFKAKLEGRNSKVVDFLGNRKPHKKTIEISDKLLYLVGDFDIYK